MKIRVQLIFILIHSLYAVVCYCLAVSHIKVFTHQSLPLLALVQENALSFLNYL